MLDYFRFILINYKNKFHLQRTEQINPQILPNITLQTNGSIKELRKRGHFNNTKRYP